MILFQLKFVVLPESFITNGCTSMIKYLSLLPPPHCLYFQPRIQHIDISMRPHLISNVRFTTNQRMFFDNYNKTRYGFIREVHQKYKVCIHINFIRSSVCVCFFSFDLSKCIHLSDLSFIHECSSHAMVSISQFLCTAIIYSSSKERM